MWMYRFHLFMMPCNVCLSGLAHLAWWFLGHPCCCRHHCFTLSVVPGVSECVDVPTWSSFFCREHFFVGSVINSASWKWGVHMSFWMMIFFMFSVSRNLSVFHSGFTILNPHQDCRRILSSVHSLQCLFFVNFWWCPLWPVWGDTSL